MTADAGFSMMAKMLYLVTRLAIPPMLLAHISLQEYGLWSVCFIVVGYIGMADFGFSSVYVRLAARFHVRHDIPSLGRLLSTGILCMSIMSVFLLLALVLGLPHLFSFLQVDELANPHARVIIIGVVSIFLVDMCLNAFAYVLHGLQRFRAEQKVWMYAFILELFVIASLLFLGFGLFSLLIAFGVRYLFSISCNIVQVYRALPGLRIHYQQFDSVLLREFLHFGLAVQLSSFFSMAFHSIDRLIAGFFLGPQAIALFDLGGKLPVSAMSIPSSISQITMPAAARLLDSHAQSSQSDQSNQHRAIAHLYQQTTRSVALLASIPMAFLALFSIPICQAWLGNRAELNTIPFLMTVAALGGLLHISTGPGTAIFRGMGKIRNEFLYHALRIVCLASAMGIAWISASLDIRGIAIALASGTGIAAALYLMQHHHQLQLRQNLLLTQVILPAIGPFLVALALQQIWLYVVPSNLGRWESLLLLFAFGCVHCIAAVSVIWQCLNGTEKQHFLAFAARRGFHLPTWGTV
jgi:O-antigen/teichoic acid export membrane protein